MPVLVQWAVSDTASQFDNSITEQTIKMLPQKVTQLFGAAWPRKIFIVNKRTVDCKKNAPAERNKTLCEQQRLVK